MTLTPVLCSFTLPFGKYFDKLNNWVRWEISNQQHASSPHALQGNRNNLPQQIHLEPNETCVNESESQDCKRKECSELGSPREGNN